MWMHKKTRVFQPGRVDKIDRKTTSQLNVAKITFKELEENMD